MTPAEVPSEWSPPQVLAEIEDFVVRGCWGEIVLQFQEGRIVRLERRESKKPPERARP